MIREKFGEKEQALKFYQIALIKNVEIKDLRKEIDNVGLVFMVGSKGF